MSGTYTLYSRLLFVFALVCAAVMPFIMCSDATRASPITTQVDNVVKHTVLSRPYTPHRQHRPLFTGLPSPQTGANGETEARGSYRKTSSIIYRHSKPSRLTKSSISSNNNSPNNRPARAGTTSATQASSYHPLSYDSYPFIIKKTSYKEAASPFHQNPSEVCDCKEARKSYIKERIPRNDSPSFLSQTGRYWSTSLPTSRGLYSGYKQPNELTSAGARSTSSGTQSSTFVDLASQTATHAPSISSSSVIKSAPSREKPTPSVTDFLPGLHSVSGSDTPRHKKIQSYLFKDSRTASGGHQRAQTAPDEGPGALPTASHKRRALDVISMFPPNDNKRSQQSQRKDPTEEVQHLSDDADPLHQSTNVTNYDAQTDGFTPYQPAAQISVATEDAIMGSFVLIPRADVPGNSADGSSKSVVSSFSNGTTRGSTRAPTPGQAMQNIYGFRRFHSKWKATKKPPILSSSGSDERTNFRGFSFKITNMNPPLSPKYSFGQRKTSATVAKPEGSPTDRSSPSPGTHQGLTSAFEEAQPGPASDAAVESNPDHRRLGTDRRIDALKAFGTQSPEGDKSLVGEPDEAAGVQQGFKLPSSRIWEPKSSHMNPTSHTEPSGEDLLGISSASLGSAAKLDIESRLKSEPKTPEQTRPLAKKARLPHIVRGKRVRGRAKKLNGSTPFHNTGNDPIFRRPARLPTINADVVANASFRGVAATRRTPIPPADDNVSPTASATTQQREGEGYGNLNSKEAVRGGDDAGRGPEVDNDMKTFELFLDDEDGASGDFDASEVLSTVTTKSQGHGDDVMEMEGRRVSPGTVSITSFSSSHTET